MNSNFEIASLKVVEIEGLELFQEFNLKFSSPGPGYNPDPVYSPSYGPAPGNSPGLGRNPGPVIFYQSRPRPKKRSRSILASAIRVKIYWLSKGGAKQNIVAAI